jgi:3-hydroxy-9,10-secoandrosta-1,3,5(10)-triene-9,17-dione monooxygenase
MADGGRRDEQVRRASALVPVLKERAAQTEQLRQVPPESVRDLLDAGLVRIGNPERFGGPGLDLDTVFAVAGELGRGCGSTAWCYAVWATHNWWLGHFPEQGQEEYFAAGPDTLCSSALNPANGRAERVPGGYRVSGRWAFSSGCDAASWVIVASTVGPDEKVWLLLPRADCTLVDTWFAAGLRGTGSKDVVVTEALVPDHRAIRPDRAGAGDRTGWELHKRPSYGVPMKVFVEWALAAPVIGMAQGVVDEFVAAANARRGAGPGRITNGAALRLRLAEAAAEVDTARTVHRAGVRQILERSGQDGVWSAEERVRSARDATYGVKLCVQAVDRLYAAAGARAIMESDPIQRLHRDVNAAAHHAALSWDSVAERFGLASGIGS